MLKTPLKILAASLLLAPMSALAVPITVDFTVTGTSAVVSDGSAVTSYNGYALGTVGTGWFTIDDSIGDYSSFDVGITPIDGIADFYVSGYGPRSATTAIKALRPSTRPMSTDSRWARSPGAFVRTPCRNRRRWVSSASRC